jgi:hypothetical protein
MFAGIRLSGVPATVPVVNGTTSRGSEQLRQSTATRANLANGNFVGVANSLINNTVTIASGASGIVGLSPGPAFAVLHNGCDRLANGLTLPETRCFPENYLTANPQLNGATYIGNLARSNYHALQASYTLRPTLGFSVQTTYSWAKSMQLSTGAAPGVANAGSTGGAAYTDPLMRDLDRVRGVESLHSLRSNGTIELPIGPGKLFFSGASGWLARLIEGWQTSFILNMGTGAPVGILGAETMRYGNARYVVASPLWEIPKSNAKWDAPDGNTGTMFGDRFVTQRDPQCLDTAQVASSLTIFCTLNSLAMKVPANTSGAIALADGSSVVNVLVNPKPGEIGTLGNRTLDSFGTFFLDGNIQKTFRITERNQLSLRLDATNILNHPQLNNPGFNVNPALNAGALPFGSIAGKGAASFTGPPVQRNFQAQVRLTF